VFFLNRYVQDDGHDLRWISHSHSKKDKQKYKYTIAIFCAKEYKKSGKIERLLTHSGLCVSVDEDIETIMKDIPCMFLPRVFLQQNLNDDQKYHFEWRIDVLDSH